MVKPPPPSSRIAQVRRGLASAAETTRGREIVGGHDEDYELTVQGETPVIVRMRGGGLSVVDVSEGAPAFCAYTRIEIDASTVDEIIAGETTPAEAADRGGMLMRSRLYGGGQFMGLLRLAQKLGTFDA